MALDNKNSSSENFRIKLLGGSALLVEVDKYESEIFKPEIVNGRIAFINVIPNRRCCSGSKTNIKHYLRNVVQKTPRRCKAQNGKLGGQQSTMGAPLANSTPAVAKQRKSCSSMLGSSTEPSLSTPQPVRKAIPIRANIVRRSMLVLQKGSNVTRTYHQVNRVATGASSDMGMRDSGNDSILNGSFQLRCSPILAHAQSGKSAVNIGYSSPIDSISKWGKVLTPVRTYTRKYNEPIMMRRPLSANRANKIFSKYKPTYLVNPTRGPNVTQLIEIKKCKLKIDHKTCISPRTFKKQQTEPLDLHTMKSTTALYPKSLSFHKCRPYLDSVEMSAFDLLTNSNRKRIISTKLNEQFRKGCINKASSTYAKYKAISTATPLQQDEQMLELSNMSLQTI